MPLDEGSAMAPKMVTNAENADLRERLKASGAEVLRLRALVQDLRRTKHAASQPPRTLPGSVPPADPWHAQVSTVSTPGRHRDLIADVACALADIPEPVVLSFGCSSGFELLDLRAALPKARILGCDVDVGVLDVARATCDPLGIAIFSSTPKSVAAFGPFDAVCAFNVFLRYPDISGQDEIAHIYRFEEFDRQIGEVCRAIRPGGILALYNACYAFSETTQASQFEALPTGRQPHNGWVDRYDRAGRRTTRAGIVHEGRRYTVTEWHERLLALNSAEEWQKREITPCEHIRLRGGAPPDLKTTMWRKTSV
jgi:SAM-dependent methyltransferase